MKIAPPELCTGCMACVASCQYEALSITIDGYGYYKVEANHSKCKECGLCSRVCPILYSVPSDKDALCLSSPYAAWALSRELRMKGASGGAFAALGQFFLKNEGVVYGAAIEGFTVRHLRVDDISRLPFILGSKYQPSDMREVYSQIKKDLRSGRKVLFGGLSCQVAGVQRYVGSRLSDSLYTVDTICGGVSSLLPMFELKETGLYHGIESFRDKSNGWRSKGFAYALKMKKADGGVENLGSDNAVIECFNNIILKRSSCLDCKFNGYHRNSDCTIGDFWGDSRFTEQHHDGLSVMVIHNHRLDEILKLSDIQLSPISWNELVNFNSCYYWSHYPYIRKSITRRIMKRRIKSSIPMTKALRMNKIESFLSRAEMYFYMKRNHTEQMAYKERILSGV